MSFNPDPSKKAQEVIFSRKVNNVLHPPLTFNNLDVGQISSQKHLEMFLEKRKFFLTYLFYFNIRCIEQTFTIYNFYILKTLLYTLLWLHFKIVDSLQCILKIEFESNELLVKAFGSPNTSNWIYLLRNLKICA